MSGGKTGCQVLQVRTGHREQMLDITSPVRDAITASGVEEGLCVVFCPHTTAAVTINENADPDVVTDVLGGMSRLAPMNAGYRHAEGNSDGHIKSSLFGPSLTLIVEGREPVLGTWQGIYFCEWDGPRNRRVFVKTLEG